MAVWQLLQGRQQVWLVLVGMGSKNVLGFSSTFWLERLAGKMGNGDIGQSFDFHSKLIHGFLPLQMAAMCNVPWILCFIWLKHANTVSLY